MDHGVTLVPQNPCILRFDNAPLKLSKIARHIKLLKSTPKVNRSDMPKKHISRLALTLPLVWAAGLAQAQGFFPIGQCAIIVASRQSVAEVRAWIVANSWEKEAAVFSSANGWFPISIGVIDASLAPNVLQRGKSTGRLPADAYCSTGKNFLREVEWWSAQAPSLSYSNSIWAEFDARPFSLAEKRFLQAALALEGFYTGLIDGAWGRGSQGALERFTSQHFDRKPLNADAAYLVMTTIDAFLADGWEARDVGYLAISVMLPMDKMRLTKRDGLREKWEHTEKDVSVIFDDLTSRELLEFHKNFSNLEGRLGEPYTVRQPDRWVTSVNNAWGTGYIRSELIEGTWSTVAIFGAKAHRSEVGLISSSITVGKPVQIVPERNGLLITYSSDLATILAEDDQGADRSDSNGRVGVSQTPRTDERNEGQGQSSGTGFFVNSQGAMLTNAHVVQDCRSITVDGKPADIVAVSQTFDLAVVKPSVVDNVAFLTFARTEAGLNADITIAGYPLHGLLGGLNVSRGSISAMTGLRGDETSVQISAPVQPGNSGGPVIDRSGNLVGVVVSKLDVMQVANLTGDIAQNVNFAIRGAMAKTFLQANGVDYEERSSEEDIRPEQSAKMLQASTRLIQCVSN